MKETRFIAQNKEKWLESETLLADSTKDPEKLSNLFTQVVDDLSYSRTYYPNRSVRVYLNKIAREYFSIIYSHQREEKNRFKLFWLDELPQIIIHSKKQLLISFLIFILSASIGVFSSYKDSQFTSSILGESYVAMTKENIKNGDPMAVYKKGHQVDMFLGITFNNLKVAFQTYLFGIFLSIGTIAILMYNGIMVGCFQFFFIEKGLFAESALTIWLHGTLEISSIIIAGGAGLTLGSGLIFPGTYSRLQAFQISAIRSLKLMLGIAPIIVLAGIIESFLTRYTEMPDFLRLVFIILSACFIIGYFIVYPWLKSRSGFEIPLAEVKLQSNTDEAITYDRIKNNAELVKDAFLFFKTNFNNLLPWLATATLFTTVATFFVTDTYAPARLFGGNWLYLFLSEMFYGLQTPSPIFILINTLGSALIVHRVFRLIDTQVKNSSTVLFDWRTFSKCVIIIAIVYTALYSLEQWGIILIIFSFSIFLLYAFTQLTENVNLVQGFAKAWRLSRAHFGQVIGLEFILLLMCFSFLIILSTPVFYMNTSVLQWNFAKTDVWAQGIIRFIEIYLKIFSFNLILPILAASSAYLYFTLAEIQSAANLKRHIAMIGNKSIKIGKR